MAKIKNEYFKKSIDFSKFLYYNKNKKLEAKLK
jgi:hypothetical protein